MNGGDSWTYYIKGVDPANADNKDDMWSRAAKELGYDNIEADSVFLHYLSSFKTEKVSMVFFSPKAEQAQWAKHSRH